MNTQETENYDLFTLVDKFELLDFSPASTAALNLTKTMIDKAIIDANASIRQLARLFNVDYDELRPAQKVRVPALLCNGEDGSVTFYKTARGDRRISIQKIKKIANVGDTLQLTWGKSKSDELIIIVKN